MQKCKVYKTTLWCTCVNIMIIECIGTSFTFVWCSQNPASNLIEEKVIRKLVNVAIPDECHYMHGDEVFGQQSLPYISTFPPSQEIRLISAWIPTQSEHMLLVQIQYKDALLSQKWNIWAKCSHALLSIGRNGKKIPNLCSTQQSHTDT